MTPESGDDPDAAGWLSASAAAAALGVSQRTVRRAIARGDLPAAKHAGAYRIAREDLARYQARRVPVMRLGHGGVPHLVPFPAREPIAHGAPPRPRTPLIGREDEVAALVDLLGGGEASLVTLRGPGGVGKTRLAVQVAADVAPAFPDGVWFVRLARVRDPGLVATTILHALGAVEQPNRPPPETLTGVVGNRRCLLVLDNLEHLLAAAPLVADVLGACPRLAILATSRARLNLSGELEVLVDQMVPADPRVTAPRIGSTADSIVLPVATPTAGTPTA